MVYSSIEGSNPSLSASSRQYPRSLSPVPVKTAGHGQGNDQGRSSRLTEPPVFRQTSDSVSCAPVAHLDIAPGNELGGRESESLRARPLIQDTRRSHARLFLRGDSAAPCR